MKPASDSRITPRMYLVPDSRRDAPSHQTTLGIGPSSEAAGPIAPDGSDESPYPLSRTKLGVQPAPEPGTSFEDAAAQMIEESARTGWFEPIPPAPPFAPSAIAPPVEIPRPVITPEYDVDLDSLNPPPRAQRTPLREHVGRAAALLVLAGIVAVGVMALDRAMTARNEPSELVPPPAAAPAETAPKMSIGAATPDPKAAETDPLLKPMVTPEPPEPMTLTVPPPKDAAENAVVNPPVANPRALPPGPTTRAAAAEATAKPDWTAAPADSPPPPADSPQLPDDARRKSSGATPTPPQSN